MVILGALANKLSSELARFDDADVIRHSRSMQEALRSYVPGAVAEGLAAGRTLKSTTAQVTVLFVDIRDYTSFSERRRIDEVFSVINQYTQAVSAAVQRHGGSIVEFNGDGMMAVFGAPVRRPDKERDAVAAARQIVTDLERVEHSAVDGAPNRMRVGIGIATGDAFVGNVQAADRRIWTALGSTVNLAARLEGLSKLISATIVIDHDTWRAAGEERTGFDEHRHQRIRGFERRYDVFAQPVRA
jgi:adenylate cyclase